LPIWEERFPQRQAMRGKELFWFAERFGASACSATMLYRYTTPCHPWLHGLMIWTH